MYSEIFNIDYKICIGANQAENDALVKGAPQHAMWFHLKDFPSAHAVVVNTAKAGTYDADVIRRAATLVKERAAVNVRGLRSVGVNYLPAKYVRRTETPGKVIMTKAAKCIHI
jgi:predicted ribosome quality control (RQC) complex YloA/Tae2 family protein